MKTLRINLDRSLADNAIKARYTVPSPTPAGKVPLLTLEQGVYHADDISVINVATGLPLVKGTDYVEAAYSRHLKLHYNLDGFGGVAILNPAISGELDIEVKFVGGGYSVFGTQNTPDFLELRGDDLPQYFWDDLVEASASEKEDLTLATIANKDTRVQELVNALAPLEELNRGLTTVATRKAIVEMVEDTHVHAGNILGAPNVSFNQHNQAHQVDIEAERISFGAKGNPGVGAAHYLTWEPGAWYSLSFDLEISTGGLRVLGYNGDAYRYLFPKEGLLSSGRFNITFRPEDFEMVYDVVPRILFYDHVGDCDAVLTNISLRKHGDHIQDILEKKPGKLETTAKTVAEAINEVLADVDQLEGGAAFEGYINANINLNTFNENYDAGWIVGAKAATVQAHFEDGTLQKGVTFGQAVFYDRVTERFRIEEDTRQVSITKMDWYDKGMPTGHKIVHELVESITEAAKLPPVMHGLEQGTWKGGASYAAVRAKPYAFYTIVSEDNIPVRLYKANNSYTVVTGLLGDVVFYDHLTDSFTVKRGLRLGAHRRGSIISEINELIGNAGGSGLSGGTVLYSYAKHVNPALIPLGAAPQSRSKYKELFGAIGTTFGQGDGSTTFGVPSTAQHLFGGTLSPKTVMGPVMAGPGNFAGDDYTETFRQYYGNTDVGIEADKLVFSASGSPDHEGVIMDYNWETTSWYTVEFDLVLTQGELTLFCFGESNHDGTIQSAITRTGHHEYSFSPQNFSTDGMGPGAGLAFIDSKKNTVAEITNIVVKPNYVEINGNINAVDKTDATRYHGVWNNEVFSTHGQSDGSMKAMPTSGTPSNLAMDTIGNGVLYFGGGAGPAWQLYADPMDGTGPVQVANGSAEGLTHIWHYSGDLFIAAGPTKLYTYNRTTEALTEIGDHTMISINSGIAITKDGKFYLGGRGMGYSVIEADVDGLTITPINNAPGRIGMVTTNANGELVCADDDFDNPGLYVYDFQVKTFIKMVSLTVRDAPIYSPEHDYYYFYETPVGITRTRFGLVPNGFVVAGAVTE